MICADVGALRCARADPYTLFLGELTLMGFAETRRLMDYRKPGSQSKQFFLGLEAAFGGSGNPAYPGGQWFNMTGMGTKDEAEMKKLKANEVKKNEARAKGVTLAVSALKRQPPQPRTARSATGSPPRWV